MNPNHPPVYTIQEQWQRVRDAAAYYKRKFKVEMDCKNQAYSFIIAMGLLEEFSKYIDDHAGYDAMELCRAELFKYIVKTQAASPADL